MVDIASSSKTARLLFLHAQTALHSGSGTALGTVDLPLLRERQTHWPTVPGCGLKGILRDHCRKIATAAQAGESHQVEKDAKKARALTQDPSEVAIRDDANLVAAFGPSNGTGASDHAGALTVTDARLAAFPVRSFRGVFAWLTCPAVLTRLGRDLKLVRAENMLDVPQSLGDADLLCAADSPLRGSGSSVVLEEFEYTVRGTCDAVTNWLAANATGDKLTAQRLKSHLAVVGDDAFTHYARYSTEIVARVGLDYATKTVKDGSLFYQEFLPAESLLYAVVLANPSRKEGHAKTAFEVLDYLSRQLGTGTVLQVGGGVTVGMGFCFAHLTDGGGLTCPPRNRHSISTGLGTRCGRSRTY